jgi:hypothetical protein
VPSGGVFQVGAATSNWDNAIVRVGIDLDGVCYDFALHLRRYLVEWLGHAPEPYEHLHSWDFWTRWGWDEERYLAACHEAVDAGCLFATGEPHQGTREALATLAAAGHELHIVTARDFGSAPGASERATLRWLEEYRIPYTSLTISHDKTSIPTDIFVEDYLPNYEKLRAAGTTAYLINREWNAPYDDGRNRVADIGEFARVVLDTAEQR